MIKTKIVFFHIVCFTVLTVFTQVGGILWFLAVIISYKLKQKKRYTFPIVYLMCNLLIIPPIASVFGREKLPMFNDDIKPVNIIYPLLFRNYVAKNLHTVLKESAKTLSEKQIQITYLDANFPFLNGFPLLPHRSHSDGKKIDIAFMYTDNTGLLTSQKPSSSGYGAYVKATNYTTENCIKKGYWQYHLPKYLTFGIDRSLQFNKNATRAIIKEFLTHSATEKIFIEPYLKQELHLNNGKIRFHGCKAVRHDDHIHLQTK
jgi:hypothetical protein